MAILTTTATGFYDEDCLFWHWIQIHDFPLYLRNISDKWIKDLETQIGTSKVLIDHLRISLDAP